jgi:integral membrane protein (TIGR00529 family)
MDATTGFAIILLSITIIILLPRFKVNIAVAILIGALFLLLALGADWGRVIDDLLNFHDFWRIIFIVFLSLLIVALMEKIGYLEMMVQSVKALAPSVGSSMVSISAFIGLLPMPGGAYVSARLVDPLARELKLNPLESTTLNYWFRHLWEYAWPLYTGVIVAAAIFNVSISDFVIHMSFLPLLAILGGFFFIYFPIMRKKNAKREKPVEWKKFLSLLYSAWPIIIVMLLTLGGVPYPSKNGVAFYRVDLFYSLLIADIALISILLFKKRVGDVKYGLKFALKPTFLGVTFAALFMKIAVLETNSMFYTYEFFSMYGIPPFVVIMILPFLAGLMTGVTVAYVAATFPLLIPYVGDPASFAAIALAYASGYAGHLTSPVHLCLVLSAEHFKADVYRVIRRVIPSVIFVVGVTLFLYFLFV